MSYWGIRYCIFIAILLAYSTQSDAQQNVFQRTYGNDYGNQANSVTTASDGGYVIGGWYDISALFTSEFYLIRTDDQGDTLWARTYGEKTDSNARNGSGNQGFHAFQTADQGYFFVGEVHGFGAGSSDVYAIRLDASGDTLWSRTFGSPESDYGQNALQTSDGGFLIAGYTESPDIDIRDAYLIRLNSAGNLRWARTFGGQQIDAVSGLVQSTDGGFVMVGYTFSFGATSSQVYIIKTDSSGEVIWDYSVGGSSNDYGYSIDNTLEGGYIISGATESIGAGEEDLLLLKLDSLGNLVWSRAYGGQEYDAGNSVVQCLDGGFAVAGFTQSFGAGNRDVYLVRTNANGDTLWTRAYGGVEDDMGSSIRQTIDGGFIIAGHTLSFGVSNSDVYLIRVDSFGNSGCHEYQTQTQVTINSLEFNNVSSAVGTGARIGHPHTLTGYTISNSTNACDFTIGLKEPLESDKIQLFPNPTSGQLTVEINSNEPATLDMLVIDLHGVTLWETNDALPHTLDVSHLPDGIYVLQLRAARGLFTQRFVKHNTNGL